VVTKHTDFQVRHPKYKCLREDRKEELQVSTNSSSTTIDLTSHPQHPIMASKLIAIVAGVGPGMLIREFELYFR
jgi:hypothetical protein